ncbi:hypothetical protein [Metabacillus fastidiosus]|nr:hypothetical protein [Metabacillus fastidiosus]MED4461834.1 hypothetical protein [Metabacillus fastidiosus]
MARTKRGRGRKWYLLFRFEDGHRVHLYEQLQRHDLNSRLRDGWKIVS